MEEAGEEEEMVAQPVSIIGLGHPEKIRSSSTGVATVKRVSPATVHSRFTSDLTQVTVVQQASNAHG